MRLSIPDLPNPESIKNLVFDFGGVICDLDMKRTDAKFKEFGMRTFVPSNSISSSDDLLRKYERGDMTSQEFRNILKKQFIAPVNDEQIDQAWNAMLLPIPLARIRLLEKLVRDFRVFILSNSNEIHYRQYLHDFQKQSGYPDFNSWIEKAYFSFQIHLQKPGKAVFEYVLRQSRLNARETLFIDDSIENIEGAIGCGMVVHHLKIHDGEDILDLFSDSLT
ncbi:MAG: HAD family phosphatase [Bacteroidales bacterium]|nr:HAD family phosphatase [Bacteroidales bacterium]MDD4602734.1 HAD family phosphatase [Bacteroidales bacterium]